MNRLSIFQVAEFAGAPVSSGDGQVSVEKVSTDSRTVKRGELFVALRGENFDGHKFVESAARAGAVGAIVDLTWNGKVPENFALIRAEDTLQAYQKLAAKYRKSLSLKVVAITGSNGKTSTKDFAAAVLARRFRVTKTEGNFNNHVGLPRTLMEAVDAQGTVVLNADDPFTPGMAARTSAKVILAGTTAGTIRASEISQSGSGTDFTILEGAHRCRAQLPVPGLHMVQNALLAVAAGRAFGLSLEDCAAGLVAAPLTKARLQIKEIHGVQFIDDSYNANPDSMKAALRTLVELDADGKRIAVLGEMMELGDESERSHCEVGETAAVLGVDQIIAIGNVAAAISNAAGHAGLGNSRAVNSTTEAAEILLKIAEPGDLVLIKGSRAARTERVMEEFGNRRSTFVVSQ